MSDYARNFVDFFSPSTSAPLLNLASLVEYDMYKHRIHSMYSFADFKLRDLNPIIDFVMSDSCIVVDVVARCS